MIRQSTFTFNYKETPVNLSEFPTDIVEIKQAGKHILGDLHSNVMIPIWYSLKYGIANGINEKEYQQLYKAHDEIETLLKQKYKESLPFTKEEKNQLLENKTLFRKILYKIQFNNKHSYLFVGDGSADRRGDEDCMQMLYEIFYLQKIVVETLHSNHGAEFQIQCELNKNDDFIQHIEVCDRPPPSRYQHQNTLFFVHNSNEQMIIHCSWRYNNEIIEASNNKDRYNQLHQLLSLDKQEKPIISDKKTIQQILQICGLLNSFKPMILIYQHASSLYHLDILIANEIFSATDFLKRAKQFYNPTLKLLSYSLNKIDESDKDNQITLYMHALAGFETIQASAEKFGIKYDDSTLPNLVETIDQINAIFLKHVNENTVHTLFYEGGEFIRGEDGFYSKTSALFNILECHENLTIKDLAIEMFTWNRDYDEIKCPQQHNGYSVKVVNGHHGSAGVKDNRYNLNNAYLGKEKKLDNGYNLASIDTDEHFKEPSYTFTEVEKVNNYNINSNYQPQTFKIPSITNHQPNNTKHVIETNNNNQTSVQDNPNSLEEIDSFDSNNTICGIF